MLRSQTKFKISMAMLLGHLFIFCQSLIKRGYWKTCLQSAQASNRLTAISFTATIRPQLWAEERHAGEGFPLSVHCANGGFSKFFFLVQGAGIMDQACLFLTIIFICTIITWKTGWYNLQGKQRVFLFNRLANKYFAN